METKKILIWVSLDGKRFGYRPAKHQFQNGAKILLKDGSMAKCISCLDFDKYELEAFQMIYSVASKRFKKTNRPALVLAGFEIEVNKLAQVGYNSYLNLFFPTYKNDIF